MSFSSLFDLGVHTVVFSHFCVLSPPLPVWYFAFSKGQRHHHLVHRGSATPCHGQGRSLSINRLLELAVTSTSQPCTAQGRLFSQRPPLLQFPVANTFPWTPSTPQCSLILEFELPELLKDFGLISDPTEISMYQSCKYILEQLSGQKLSMIYFKNFHLDHDEWSLFSLCTTNILPMINVTGLLVDVEFHLDIFLSCCLNNLILNI